MHSYRIHSATDHTQCYRVIKWIPFAIKYRLLFKDFLEQLFGGQIKQSHTWPPFYMSEQMTQDLTAQLKNHLHMPVPLNITQINRVQSSSPQQTETAWHFSPLSAWRSPSSPALIPTPVLPDLNGQTRLIDDTADKPTSLIDYNSRVRRRMLTLHWGKPHECRTHISVSCLCQLS